MPVFFKLLIFYVFSKILNDRFFPTDILLSREGIVKTKKFINF